MLVESNSPALSSARPPRPSRPGGDWLQQERFDLSGALLAPVSSGLIKGQGARQALGRVEGPSREQPDWKNRSDANLRRMKKIQGQFKPRNATN